MAADLRAAASRQLSGVQRTKREQARAAGFDIDEDNVIKDEGVSGISTCFAERDGGRRLLDKLRAGDVLVVRWLDRLGRNYDDVRDTVQALMRKGVIVRTVINNFTFDGSQTDPIQKSIRDVLLASMSAIGQAQAEATKLAQHAGIAHAQATERVYLDGSPATAASSSSASSTYWLRIRTSS
jgi:DNA invertase Pin-like site-specific DNA recombinase